MVKYRNAIVTTSGLNYENLNSVLTQDRKFDCCQLDSHGCRVWKYPTILVIVDSRARRTL